MKIIKGHGTAVTISIVFAVLGVILNITPYFLFSKIVGMLLQGNQNVQSYATLISLIFACFVLGSYMHMQSTVVSHNLAFAIIEEKRFALIEKLGKLPLGTIDEKSSGYWVNFVVNGLDRLEKPIAHIIPEVFANTLIPIGLSIYLFFIDWRIGLANLCTIPIGLLFTMLMMKDYQAKSKRYYDARNAMESSIVEYVKGIEVIKAFNRSASSYDKYKDAVLENKNAMLDWYLSVCFSMSAAQVILPSTLVFVIPVTLMQYMHHALPVSSVVLAILLSYASCKPLLKVMMHMDVIASIPVILKEVDDVMELEELQSGSKEQTLIGSDVCFDHVSFAYKDKEVLHDISFTAKQNELTALVGYSGSGKSTIAKLIAGFYEIKEGTIWIGGKDVKQYPQDQLHKLVTYVSQENYLFTKSIKDNLLIAKQDATQQEIIDVCKAVGCHDFIMNLEDGYETIVKNEGSTLSGGERQRITIARALLKDAPIVLLDEATAYADADNERIIQEALNVLLKKKTVLMIAHRIPTIMHANQILVMDDGRIVHRGKHDALYKESSLYKTLYENSILAKESEVSLHV